jgi:surfactin family lipopeptide synthetase C
MIEYLGRADYQVKIRGFRIELGEIESVLRQHPALREAAIVAREDTPGDKRLVAYVVPKIEDGGWKIEDGGADAFETPSSILDPPSSMHQDLRAFLKDKLPDYMIPSTFVVLAALPLTPNGKVDRRALLASDLTHTARADVFVAPRTPLEEALAGIWAGVLGLERVGVYDNFFDLGGHSLKAAQLVTRVRETFQVNLPVRSLFEATTVASMVELVVAQEARPGQSEKIARVLKRLKGTSDEDKQRLLEQKRRERGQA